MIDAPQHITLFNKINLTRRQAGMLSAFIGYTCFAFSDIIAKWLSHHYGVFQIGSMNYLVAVAFLFAISSYIGGAKSALDKQTIKLQIFRGFLNFLSSAIVIYSLSMLPISTVYAMVFAMPFFALLIGKLFYKDPIHKDRLVILVLGFIGIILAFQPWQGAVDWRLIVPLGASVVIAAAFTSARSLKPETTIFALGITPTVTAFIIATTLMLINGFVVPNIADLPLVFVNGILVCGGMVLVSQAYRLVAADLASPFLYTEMIWGLIFGFAIFADIPSIGMLVGAAIIIGCGWYLVKNEK